MSYTFDEIFVIYQKRQYIVKPITNKGNINAADSISVNIFELVLLLC